MPSVGSTPTTSPATSSVNSTQNDQQSNNNNNNNNNSIIYTQCNHQYQNHSSSSVNSTTAILNSGIIINDSTNNSSSTTTSCMSTPIHSPDLQLSLSMSSDNNPQAAALILNRYSLNSQIATVATTMSTAATIVTSPNNTSSSSSSGTHFNYNSTPSRNPFYLSNNMQIPDSSKFLIITPAVSIDRDFDNDTGAPANDECNEIFNYPSTQMTTTNFEFNNSLNNNILEKTNSSTNNINLNNGRNNYYNEQYPNYQQHQRQNYLSNSYRFKYNSIYNQQITEKYDNNRKTENNFLSKSAANTFSGFQAAASPSSWRWCSLICAAMRCFGGGRNNTGGRSHYTSTFSTRNYTQVKDDSTSFGSGNRLSNHFTCISAASPNVSANNNTGNIKTNRNLKSSYQNNLSTNMITGTFATPRKTRDHMNNICYEL